MKPLAVAARAADLPGAAPRVQLLPAGRFAARDGRPGPGKTWNLSAAAAARLVAAAERRKTPYVIDYEHQTLHAERNGQPAPAAGWFSRLAHEPGTGLFALDVEWTPKAKQMIENGEYRYISPVFSHGPDGEIAELHMAAVTNHPALDGMTMLAAAKLQLPREEPMSKLAELLGLPEDADETAIEEAVRAVLEENKSLRAELEVPEDAPPETARAAVAALKAKLESGSDPDPAKYAPVEALTALQAEVASLRAETRNRDVDALVADGLADGRLLPATEAWARDLGRKDPEALKAFLKTAPAVAALTGTQTGGTPPDDDTESLSSEERAVCAALGLDPSTWPAA